MKFYVTPSWEHYLGSQPTEASVETVEAKGFNMSDGFAHFYNENNQLVALYNLTMVLRIVPDSGDLEAAWKQKQQEQTTKQRT